MILPKTVDEILNAGRKSLASDIFARIDHLLLVQTIIHGPELKRYFGLSTLQLEDMSVTIDGDDKTVAIKPSALTRLRRSKCDEPLNSMEKRALVSTSCSIGWIAITASYFCSEPSSRMQQCASNATGRTLIELANGLKNLIRLVTEQALPSSIDTLYHQLTVLFFSESGHSFASSQLSYVGGWLADGFEKGLMYHVLTRSSHKTGRPARSTASARILAAEGATDKGKMLADTLSGISR